MGRRTTTGLVFSVAVSLVLSACGASSNILGLVTPASDKETYEYHFALAKALYDEGDIEAAQEHIDVAFDLNASSEAASILYGYIYLSLAGVDPFSLAKKMSGSDEDENTAGDEDASSEGEESEEEDSSSTKDELGRIESVLGLSDEDKLKLGTMDTTDPDLPVLVPLCAGKARTMVDTLTYLNKAIYAACPFVDEETRDFTDPRHQCASVSEVRQPAKAHFLWAFSHLSEALAFNAVLNYGAQEGEDSNLEQRVAKITDQEVSSQEEMDNFLASVDSVENTVNAIFPVSGNCSDDYPTSMLIATLTDMISVDAAFRKMAGVPASITSGIQKSMEKINAVQGTSGRLTQMKADMTEKMSDLLSDKLAEIEESADVTDEQKSALCDSLGSIGGSVEDLPDICN